MTGNVMLRLFKNNRSGRYYAEYEIGGRKHQFSCKTSSRREAEKYADAEYKNRLTSKSVSKHSTYTLSQFQDDFLAIARSRYRPKYVQSIRDCFNALHRSVGNVPLSELDSVALERFLYVDQTSQFSAHRQYRTLRSAFESAVAWKKLQSNPFKEISKPRLSPVQADYLDDSEFALVIDAIECSDFFGHRLRNCVVLAFETGMRLGELRNLRIEQINLEERYIDVVNTRSWKTKNGRDRRVPLTTKAVDAVKAQMASKQAQCDAIAQSAYLFPSNVGGVLDESHASREFKKVVRRVFPDRHLHFHSLRHSMAHRAFRLNVPVFETQQILGHSTVALTERYGSYQRRSFPKYLEACDKQASG